MRLIAEELPARSILHPGAGIMASLSDAQPSAADSISGEVRGEQVGLQNKEGIEV